ncbi:hypothetical protein LTR53_011908 [Teratosphaeriaceae sp. CCFEE 6253]|nr:hypothetical protein LTR53_011908 [Teratosphaeriaceae sp. CCFEE 6253]
MQPHTSRSAAQALYRVFVSPALSTARASLQRSPPKPTQPTPQRAFSTTLPRQTKSRITERRTQKWDDEIRAYQIQLVDPDTERLVDDGEPRTRYDVLKYLDRTTHRLIQVSADEDGVDPRYAVPVCKVVSKKAMYEQDRKRKAVAKEKAKEGVKVGSVKTLELNWAIDGNDLEHRLEKVGGFLAEGRRVEIVLAAKKRGRKASLVECEGVVKRIEGVAEAVAGASVMKALEGPMGGFSTIVLQGRAPGASAQGKSGGGDGQGEGGGGLDGERAAV